MMSLPPPLTGVMFPPVGAVTRTIEVTVDVLAPTVNWSHVSPVGAVTRTAAHSFGKTVLGLKLSEAPVKNLIGSERKRDNPLSLG